MSATLFCLTQTQEQPTSYRKLGIMHLDVPSASQASTTPTPPTRPLAEANIHSASKPSPATV